MTAAEHTDASPLAGNDLTDDVVLSYLRQRGFGHAAAQLAKVIASGKIDEQQQQQPQGTNDNNEDATTNDNNILKPIHMQLEVEPMEESLRANQQHLAVAMGTSGGMGYDLDTGLEIVSWGLGGVTTTTSDHHPDDKNENEDDGSTNAVRRSNNAEARQYLVAFAALQTYVNALPDHHDTTTSATNNKPRSSSCKSELLSVCFPLLVHTYCDLLEIGYVNEARALLMCWRGFYEIPPLSEHATALQDLVKCDTQDKIASMNAMFLSYNELYTNFRKQQEKTKKMVEHRRLHVEKLRLLGNTEGTADVDLSKIDEHISILKRKELEATEKIKLVTDKLENYPFLKRARSSRWKITLSGEAFSILSSFLSSPSMLPLNNLLHSKCNVNVEERDPLPYVPGCVFEDIDSRTLSDETINWGVPSSANESLSNTTTTTSDFVTPFPKYGEPDSFNNSLLINGFRRLAALETKLKIQELERSETNVTSQLEASCESYTSQVADPFNPSTLMSTCCNIASSMSNLDIDASDIGITCATSSPIDGRRIAIGCEDSSVRVWALDGSHRRRKIRGANTVGDARGSTDNAGDAIVLLGHKGGFPVFGVDFCRDGRHLLSCGGDGTVRLWDTCVTGPIGLPEEKISKTSISSSPGKRYPTSDVDIKGAALCVYRGHALGSSLWDCRFAPSGYYFASGGTDNTARIWTTDRIAPVRALTGHLCGVSCVTWHPNCNYLLTGSDDRTVRMWDVQTGRCIRLLTGSTGNISSLEVSPNGRHAVAGDGIGNIHIWDLGTGRLVTEIRPNLPKTDCSVYSLAFSSCGFALASGGADCCVRIWDVRGPSDNRSVPSYSNEDVCRTGRNGLLSDPLLEFKTKNTQILSLMYTKRNLLMGIGRYTRIER